MRSPIIAWDRRVLKNAVSSIRGIARVAIGFDVAREGRRTEGVEDAGQQLIASGSAYEVLSDRVIRGRIDLALRLGVEDTLGKVALEVDVDVELLARAGLVTE
jgi:hypothetical protein